MILNPRPSLLLSEMNWTNIWLSEVNRVDEGRLPQKRPFPPWGPKGGEETSGPFFSWKDKLKLHDFLHTDKDEVYKFYQFTAQEGKHHRFVFWMKCVEKVVRKSSKQHLPPSNPPGCKKSLYLESGRAAQSVQRWSDHSEPGHAKSSWGWECRSLHTWVMW